jgi:iron-sulfur cluster repair protein YtfE (RIC family)
MEATALLKKDHAAVKALFKKYEAAGDGAEQTKQNLFDQIQAELDVHAAIEEQIFYPAVQEGRSGKAKDLVLEALEEHKVVNTLLEEIASLTPADDEFGAKMKVLQENVEHHADEEEREMFPEAKKQLSEEIRNELGTRMETRKDEL